MPHSNFETAIDAIISGDVAALANLLRCWPALVHDRSPQGATLLHYIAANGVEQERQRTPPNAVEIARLLLDAGAEVDARAPMYGGQATTMSMLVSSVHPARAGLQSALVDLLVDYGASVEFESPLLTALAFGYLEAAEALVRRGARVDTLPAAAGLGRRELFLELLPWASATDRHRAIALAAQHGRTELVAELLDAGEDPNRLNPPRFHGHSTPLHQAVAGGHFDTVRLLVERGARTDIEDTFHHGTALGWAKHLGQVEIANYLATITGALA